MMKCSQLFFIVACVLCQTTALSTELALAPIFSDHMVLQRDMPVPVWGTADAGTEVIVEFAGQKKSATADSSNHWKILLDPMEVSSKPRTMTVSYNRESGIINRQLSNVLVGEVWVCSGQSNMYWPLGGNPRYKDSRVDDAAVFLAMPENLKLRLYCDDEHPLWKAQRWQMARPETLKVFSATASFFGKALLDELDVPIGLINLSRGGTLIQAWTPPEYNQKVPISIKYQELYQKVKPQVQARNRALKKYREALVQFRKSGDGTRPKKPAPLPEEVDLARTFGAVSGLYNRYILPHVPYAIRGVIWYQGESNSQWNELARHYDDMLRALIEGWRHAWGQPEMPFYFVQFPCFEKNSAHWPWGRQGMLNVCQSMEHVGMAVTLDAGDREDVHSPKKKPVGDRLARWALAKTYGRGGVCSGPLPVSAQSEGAGVRIRFDLFGSALKVQGSSWNDVEVAGTDGVFYAAVAEIGQNDAFVSCSQVVEPVSVRYGWKGWFEPSLFNTDGLPGSPFCLVRDGQWRLCTGADLKGESE